MNTLVCPRDTRHGPHDGRAIFCWVCGIELLCEACEYPVSHHLISDDARCPVVKTPSLV